MWDWDLEIFDVDVVDASPRSDGSREQFVELPDLRSRTNIKCVIRSDNKVSTIPSWQFLLCYSSK